MGCGVECHLRLQSARSCISSTTMVALEVIVLCLSESVPARFVERDVVLVAGIINNKTVLLGCVRHQGGTRTKCLSFGDRQGQTRLGHLIPRVDCDSGLARR